MIMRLKYVLLSFLMIGFIHQVSFAQLNVTDKKGDKIVLMPDGTWKYADNDKQASVSGTVKAKQQTGEANIDKSKLSKSAKKQLKKLEEADKRRKKIAEKVAKQQKSKDPKGTAKKNTKPSKKDKKAKDTAKKNTKPSKKDKKTKDTAKKNTKPSKKDKKAKDTAKKNTKPSKKGDQAKGSATKNTKQKKSSQPKAKTVSNKQKLKMAKQNFKAFKTRGIVINKDECVYTVNEIDPFTGKRKVAIENNFFFGYTHPQLEKYLKGENYLTCEGYLQQVAGLKIFNVKFTIDSPNAIEDYGSLLEGSRMLISLLDGTTVTLISAEQDGGKIDRIDKKTTYKTYFVIDSKQEKLLQKSEIDQVRVVWSEGFEDYEVHNVDFLMNQLQCLNAAFK